MRSDAVIVQQATGDHRHLLSLTQPLHARYAMAHDMDFWPTFGDPAIGLGKRNRYWSKVACIRQAVEAGYRYVIWLDADALIVGEEDLRNACPQDGMGMTWHSLDWEAVGIKGGYDHLNVGCMYLGVGSNCKRALAEWWKEPDDGHFWPEQHALNKVAKRMPSAFTKLDHRYNSTVPNFVSDRPAVMAWHGWKTLPERLKDMAEVVRRVSSSPRLIPADSVAGAVATGKMYRKSGEFTKAIAYYHAALKELPDDREILGEIADTYVAAKDQASAILTIEKAIGFYPTDSMLWTQLAACWDCLGEFDQAGAALKEAIRLAPNAHALRMNLGIWLLREGHWEQGWENYRWGFLTNGRSMRTLAPDWDGTPVETLFLWAEQGCGDTFQFCRYVNEVLRRGLAQNIVLEVQKSLVPIMQGQFPPEVRVVGQSPDGNTPFEFDAHIGLISLARVLDVAPENCCRSSVPYLSAPQEKVDEWHRRMGGKFRVGFSFQGNPSHGNDHHRSMDAGYFDPLADTPGCEFWCLQTDIQIPDEVKAEFHGKIEFVGDELIDWTDTAAAIMACDLIITVDTAIAHLAGALGKPCWVLLSKSSDWRWLRDTEECVWYPNLKLYRQGTLDIWQPVMAKMKSDLLALTGQVEEPQEDGVLMTVDAKYGRMTFNKNDLYIGRSLQFYGEYSEGEVDLFRKFVKPGDVVLDVGAQIGCHTVALAKLVGEAGEVYAFEPTPWWEDCLVRNILQNRLANVTKFRFGLGAESTTMRAPDWDESIPNKHGTGYMVHEPGEIDIKPLDVLPLQRCDFIKIDVDGMEEEVLRGGRETIARCKPVLYVENDQEDRSASLIATLEEMGYSCFWHCPALFNPENARGNPYDAFGGVVSANMLCLPKGKERLAQGLKNVRECPKWQDAVAAA